MNGHTSSTVPRCVTVDTSAGSVYYVHTLWFTPLFTPVLGGMRALNGPLMRRQRRRLGLRQADVARELGVDRSTVASWETGRSVPDARLIVPLAAFLETTTDKLLRAEEAAEQST